MDQTFSADVVQPFIATITVFPPRFLVELSDGHVGVVVKTNRHDRLRPVVLLYDPHSVNSPPPIIDLSRERGLRIAKSLAPVDISPTALKVLSAEPIHGYALTATYAAPSLMPCHPEHSALRRDSLSGSRSLAAPARDT